MTCTSCQQEVERARQDAQAAQEEACKAGAMREAASSVADHAKRECAGHRDVAESLWEQLALSGKVGRGAMGDGGWHEGWWRCRSGSRCCRSCTWRGRRGRVLRGGRTLQQPGRPARCARRTPCTLSWPPAKAQQTPRAKRWWLPARCDLRPAVPSTWGPEASDAPCAVQSLEDALSECAAREKGLANQLREQRQAAATQQALAEQAQRRQASEMLGLQTVSSHPQACADGKTGVSLRVDVLVALQEVQSMQAALGDARQAEADAAVRAAQFKHMLGDIDNIVKWARSPSGTPTASCVPRWGVALLFCSAHPQARPR